MLVGAYNQQWCIDLLGGYAVRTVNLLQGTGTDTLSQVRAFVHIDDQPKISGIGLVAMGAGKVGGGGKGVGHEAFSAGRIV
ncbi:MAG: hypothetical protein U0175_17340 [Caldilineaceae bacterium]